MKAFSAAVMGNSCYQKWTVNESDVFKGGGGLQNCPRINFLEKSVVICFRSINYIYNFVSNYYSLMSH